jgi:hypothetical protein
MKSKKIFISHAVRNKGMADLLVDLIETGIGISSDDIFCSSLEGLGIPSGVNFVDFIKGQISEPKVVILILTKNYFSSNFCVCELGASWVLSHIIIPIIVPPLNYEDIKSVLTGVQLQKISDKNNLNQIQLDIIEALDINGKSFARWEVKRDDFIMKIEKEITDQKTDEMVDIKEYKKVKSDYENSKKEMKELLDELEKSKALVSKLKKLKDHEEVSDLIKEELDEKEQFEELIKNSKKTFNNLPAIVLETLYFHMKDEILPWPGFGEDYKRDIMKKAIDDDYLYDEGNGVDINPDDPKVKRALERLEEIRNFCESYRSPEFIEFYEDEYDHQLNFKSKRFWETHLS